MGLDESLATQDFHAAPRMFVLVGIPIMFFLGLGIAVAIKSGDWTILGIAAPGAFILGGSLLLLKLEVGTTGFRYRAPIGSCRVAYGDVGAAGIHAVRHEGNPREYAKFALETRAGRLIRPSLRSFPIEAAAALFAALETNGIEIEVADSPGPQRMNAEIRAVQARLRT